MRTPRSRSSRLLAAGLALAVGSGGLAGCQPVDVEVEPTGQGEASVVKVIDGDTIQVRRAGRRATVRVLNIDTPETVAPGRPVDCLGPEATRLVTRLLPEGAAVRLDYDEDRTDRHGRTLARLVRGSEPVSVTIARAGLGVPVTVAPNSRYRAEVDAAFAEAVRARRGLLSPEIPCTLPAQIARLERLAAQVEGGAVELADVESIAYGIQYQMDGPGMPGAIADSVPRLRRQVTLTLARARLGAAKRTAAQTKEQVRRQVDQARRAGASASGR